MEYNKPMVEFVLWSNCNMKCEFCWQRKLYPFLYKQDMLKSIQLVRSWIQNNLVEGSDVLIVGGELFVADEEAMNELIELFRELAFLANIKKVRLIYFNTNLTHNNIDKIDEIIDIFKQFQVLDRLKFTTSYDTYGRFTKQQQELWLQNLQHFENSGANIVINTILTRQQCELLNKNGFKDWPVKNTKISYLPYIGKPGDEMQPSKELLYNTLLRYYRERPEEFVLYCRTFLLKQQKILFEYKNGKLVDSLEDTSPCGHNVNFCKVLDDKTCYLCLLEQILQSVE